MAAIFFAGLVGAAVVTAWAFCLAIGGGGRVWLRICYLLIFLAAAIAAYYSTFRCEYYVDANTRFHGWPVPVVVFQRDGPGEPWLDFVGPTVVLGYPINLFLFLAAPSIMMVVFGRKRGVKPIQSEDVG